MAPLPSHIIREKPLLERKKILKALMPCDPLQNQTPEFARNLPKPEVFDVIKDAEPLGPILPYQFSTNRYYEELARFPEGFVVSGDALCSFNPVYGQGMTVACTEAMKLRECLAKAKELDVGSSARRVD
jgi:2-polyprenyl-6-methoxyphenol hydroxylase-like FAD-dependent oxidoreductase